MSKSEHQKTVQDFLTKQNRPMSANDILNNFTGQLTKTNITNALEQLNTDKKIIEKIYGKQKVFMTLQTTNCATFKQDLRDLEEKKINAKGELSRVQFDNSRMDKEIKGFGDQVPIGELERQNKELATEVEVLKEQLSKMKGANVEFISKDEKSKIQKEHTASVKLWRKYKRIANEMIATIVENCNMSKAKLCEDLCIVLDEHENVQPPQII